MDTRLSDDEIKRLWEMARRHFIGSGYPHYIAEDFAQFYMLKVITRGQNVSMKLCLIDFLREEFGSHRTANGEAKSRHRLRENLEPLAPANSQDPPELPMKLPPIFTDEEAYIIVELLRQKPLEHIGIKLNYKTHKIHRLMRQIREKFLENWDFCEYPDIRELARKKLDEFYEGERQRLLRRRLKERK